MAYPNPTDDDIITEVAFSHFRRNTIPRTHINNNIKIMSLLTSPRFLGIVTVGIIQALVLFGIISGVQGEGLANIISAVVAGAVAVGTLDRIGSQV
jgi:hypothetical protein